MSSADTGRPSTPRNTTVAPSLLATALLSLHEAILIPAQEVSQGMRNTAPEPTGRATLVVRAVTLFNGR